MNSLVNREKSLVPDSRIVGVESGFNVVDCKLLNSLEKLMTGVVGNEFEFLFADFGLNVLYEIN